MKKNLVLVVGLILILSMVVSISALPSWLTGKATGTDSVSIKVNKGETKSFSLGGETHEISLVFMDDASVVVLSVDGANTGGIVKGATYESGNLKVKVLTIRYSNNWFSKNKYVTLEVSRVESEVSEIECFGTCNLREGETATAEGHEVSINWIDNNEVVFTVDGQRVPASGRLQVGSSYKLNDGSYLFVSDISKLEVSGEVGSVRFEITGTTSTTTTFGEIKVGKDTDTNMKLTLPLKDGIVSFYVLYTGIGGNVLGIGGSIYEQLATSDTNTLLYYERYSGVDYHRYFVASNIVANESYLLRAKISEDTTNVRNKTTIDKKTSNGWVTVCEEQTAGDKCIMGNVVLNINSVKYTSGGNETVEFTGGYGVSFNQAFTTDGLKVYLPSTANGNSVKISF